MSPVPLDPGKYFFHYTTRDAAFGGILPSRSLRLSPYGAMRDPSRTSNGGLPSLVAKLISVAGQSQTAFRENPALRNLTRT
jgi:hypothetical protein